jgi:glucose 1-dehydrogenase
MPQLSYSNHIDDTITTAGDSRPTCRRASGLVYGSIDILVNNADLQRHAPLIDMTLEDWEEVLRVNLIGQFLSARQAAKEFLRRGVVPETSCSAGKVICLSSVHDVIPWAGHAHYSASASQLFMRKPEARSSRVSGLRAGGPNPGRCAYPKGRASRDRPKDPQALCLARRPTQAIMLGK